MNDEQRRLLRQKQEWADAIEHSRLPGNTMHTHRLETFTVDEDNREAYLAACDFVAVNPDTLASMFEDDHDGHGWQVPPDFLTFYGPPGTGKTHLAIAILWQDLKGCGGVYWQVEDLLDSLRRTFKTDDNQRFERIMNSCLNDEVLVLDDLGSEQSTEWARAQLDHIIDHRYINGLRTVITTNLEPDKLPPRIASRVLEGTVVVLDGKDFRILKARRREYDKKHKKGAAA